MKKEDIKKIKEALVSVEMMDYYFNGELTERGTCAERSFFLESDMVKGVLKDLLGEDDEEDGA